MNPSINSSDQIIQVREWNGTPIQRRTTDGYVNATAMCKANRKRWNHYWETRRSNEYAEALSAEAGIPASELVQVRHGNETWVHPQMAVDLARWISSPFAVFMDGWFLEGVSQPAQHQPQPQLGGDKADTALALQVVYQTLLSVPGVRPGIAASGYLDCLQINVGLDVTPLRPALPAAEGPICSLNATKIGLLLDPTLSAKSINKRLAAAGLQTHCPRNGWELTTAGRRWGEALPFSNGKRSGYQILWNPAVADQIQQAVQS